MVGRDLEGICNRVGWTGLQNVMISLIYAGHITLTSKVLGLVIDARRGGAPSSFGSLYPLA